MRKVSRRSSHSLALRSLCRVCAYLPCELHPVSAREERTGRSRMSKASEKRGGKRVERDVDEQLDVPAGRDERILMGREVSIGTKPEDRSVSLSNEKSRE